MKYAKPIITALASATCAIQRQLKDNSTFNDTADPTIKLSVAAYEADE